MANTCATCRYHAGGFRNHCKARERGRIPRWIGNECSAYQEQDSPVIDLLRAERDALKAANRDLREYNRVQDSVLAELRGERDTLRAALADLLTVEWLECEGMEFCPWCDGTKPYRAWTGAQVGGHAATCVRARASAALKEQP